MADLVYGGFYLKRGDSDSKKIWGGTPSITASEYVKELHSDLWDLGFRIVNKDSSAFGRETEWAVREFQIYAKMAFVARDIAKDKPNLSRFPEYSRLVEQPNNEIYEGKVSGVVNSTTAQLIKRWKEKGWRCPVIACAFQLSNGERIVDSFVDNLWAGDKVLSDSSRVYVRDFTRYYYNKKLAPRQLQILLLDPSVESFSIVFGTTEISVSDRTTASLKNALNRIQPENKIFGNDGGPWEIHFDGGPKELTVTGIAADNFHLATVPEWLVIGDYAKYGKSGGPRSLPPNHCPSEYGGELLPESLTGKTVAEVVDSPTLKSTYRVVRAVSEVECLGFFDSLNAYDTGLISLGPCHWILGLKSKDAISAGELGGFLSYLKEKYSASFKKVIGQFGVEVIDEWAGSLNGAKLFNKSLRTYTTWLKLETEDGFTPLSKTWREASWFKTWHWIYRFVMAGRTQFSEGVPTNSDLAGYRLAMWDMARIRLRNILMAEWPKIDDVVLQHDSGNARIGDVFISELATALLLRWHINAPGTLLRGGKASQHLVKLIRIVDSGSIEGLVERINSDAAQGTLTTKLIEYVTEAGPFKPLSEAKKNLVNTLNEIIKWPGEESVRKNRGYKLLESAASPLNSLSEKLLTTKDSFKFDKQGIDVAQLPTSGDKVQYVAIPITPAPISDPSFLRFGVSLLTKLFDAPTPQLLAEPVPIKSLALTIFTPGNTASTPDDGESLPVIEQPFFMGFKFPIEKAEGDNIQFENLNTNLQLDESFIIFNETADPHNQNSEIVELRSVAGIGKQNWKLDIPTWDFLGSTPEVKVVLEDGKVRLDLTLKNDSLPRSFNWSFGADGFDNAQWTTFNFDISDSVGSDFEVAHIKFNIDNKPLTIDYGLPLVLNGTVNGYLDFEVAQGLDRQWQISPKLSLTVTIEGDTRIDLGSPLAQLALSGGFKIEFDPEQGLRFILNENTTIKLYLDLFEELSPGIIANNIWSDSKGQLLELSLSNLKDLQKEDLIITWKNGFPAMSKVLISRLLGNITDITVDTGRRLQSLAGSVLGDLIPTKVTFDKCGSTTPVEFDSDNLKLKICLKLSVTADPRQNKPILEGKGQFIFEYGGDKPFEDDLIIFKPGAFRCTGESLIRTTQSYVSSFSDLISLHIPANMAFKFICAPQNPKLVYDPGESERDGLPSRITIRVPAAEDDKPKNSTFTFEMEEFALHGAGFDLKGAIRSEKVEFGKFFAEPLVVKSPERNVPSENLQGKPQVVGWLEFRNSTLIAGSFQASAKLKYFDDATGTFTLLLAQDPANKQLDIAGSLEISSLSEFHVDRLYLSCQIAMFHLGIKYDSSKQDEQKWLVEAWMTGRIKFAPPRGQSAGNMKELAELFSGLECEFEKLDPIKLTSEKISLTFPPKRFEFANIFDVDLRGISFVPKLTSLKDSLTLLGDINIKQLPGIESSLKFGNITLVDGNPPTFTVDRIGAQFSLPSGFSLDGEFGFIEFENESGFVGSFALKTEIFPNSRGLLKLTRVRTGDRQNWVPSIAIYLETDIDAPLFADLHLRSAGVGLGIYQALNGLEPSSLPLPQKIIKLVNSSAGLPQPRRIESWKAAPPATVNSDLNWMFVASGLLTLSKLDDDKPHPLASSVLFALDQDLQLVVGVNVWLFASPNDTKSAEFASRPVGLGAVGLSIKEQRLFASFRTLKNAKLRDDAPAILKEVLSKVETTMLFSADPRGMLLEVGWPWETRIQGHALGERISGELISGFRFGVYQGVVSFGLNYAVKLALEAEARVGFEVRGVGAEAYLSAKGNGSFRASFAGAIDGRNLQAFLLGDVRINSTLALQASASVYLCIKFTRWFKLKFSINFNVELAISISFALTAALQLARDSSLGFAGEAEVAISVCGYRLAGILPFAYRPEAIDSTRNRIENLLPPRLNNPVSFSQGFNDIKTLTPAKQGWNYRFTKIEVNEARSKKFRIRVLLFPMPGTVYPQVVKLFSVVSENASGIVNELTTGSAEILTALTSIFVAREKSIYIGSQVTQLDNKDDLVTLLHGQKGWRINGFNIPENQRYLLILLTDGSLDVFLDPVVPRFSIKLKGSDAFKGFVGSSNKTKPIDLGLAWSENLQDEIKDLDLETQDDPDLKDTKIYVRDVLSSLSNGTTDFQGKQEISDLRPLNPSPNHVDDETKSIDTEQVNSPNLDRNTDYDKALSAAWKPPTSRSFIVSYKDSNKEIESVIAILNEFAQTPKAPIYSDKNEKYDTLKQLIKKGGKNEVPLSIYIKQLTELQAQSFQAQVAWQIEPGDVAPNSDKVVSGYYILKISEGLKIIPNDYQAGVETALSPGMLLAELLELMNDEAAKPGEYFNKGFTPYLNLVLEFELPDELKNKFDPVPDLINLKEGIKIEGGEALTLESPLGEGVERPDYDLFVVQDHQDNDKICLNWLFLREDLAQPQLEVDSENPFAAYTELHKFIVTRRSTNNLSDDSTIFSVLPSWIKGKDNNGPEILIRPQFQFVDDQLENIPVGTPLEYVIEAKAPDRILASCRFNTVRRKVMPLPPVSQSLALQDLNKGEIEIVVAVDSIPEENFKLTSKILGSLLEDKDFAKIKIDAALNSGKGLIDKAFDDEFAFRKAIRAVQEIKKFEGEILDKAKSLVFKPSFVATELKLRYRLVRAKTIGSYGFESPLAVTTEWSKALPSRENDPKFPQIEFASVQGVDRLPWRQTTTFDNDYVWKEETKEFNDGRPTQFIYRTTIKESDLSTWRIGQAIEFYVGREVANKEGQPIEKSPLLKCRHAIIPIPISTTAKQFNRDVNSFDLSRGNTVEALEYLPSGEPQSEWLDPQRVIEHQIQYPESKDKDQKTFQIALAWRHDLSKRQGYDDPMLMGYDSATAASQQGFNPVIGYRLYRYDAYDPNPFPTSPEVFIRVIPDQLYRAQPLSIDVLGLADQADPTVSRSQQPKSVDQETGDRLDAGLIKPVADWIPTAEKDKEILKEMELSFPEGPLSPPFENPEKLPGRTVWLHKDIQSFIEKLKAKLNAEAVIGLKDPLELKAEVIDDSLISKLQTLQTELNGKTDPYAWRTLEAFGLSCECRFQDKSGQVINTEKVINAINDIENGGLPLVSVGIFLAEDGKTPLNVIRLVYARKLRDWEDQKRAFDLDVAFAHRYLGTKIINGAYSQATLASGLRSLLLTDKFREWLKDINNRLVTSQLVTELPEGNPTEAIATLTYFRYDARTSQSESNAENLPSQAVVSLPLNREGRIEYQLTVPDLWAHQYEISLDIVRRYDRAKGRDFGALVKAPLQDKRIVIDVMRSQELSPHNLLATPLNGGIQAVVFRHPAAFAAAASALQAAHIQYSGQTVRLERRIDPTDQPKLTKLYQLFKQKYPYLDWQRYQTWLSTTGKEDVAPGPELHNRDSEGIILKPKSPQDPLYPVEEGSLPAVYGADRYVVPDLPGYYQYRFIAYSTAGIRHSEPKATAWVSPLYEGGEDARQRPFVEPCTLATYDATEKTLTLQIPLIHPRQHLLKEVQGLWVDAEEWFEFEVATNPPPEPLPKIALRFGSLPDLYLTYQIYFWSNQDVGVRGDGTTRVYIPLFKIEPPRLVDDTSWFNVIPQTQGLTSKLEIIQDIDGQMLFEISSKLENCPSLLEALNALNKNDAQEIIFIESQRGGVKSEILPKLE